MKQHPNQIYTIANIGRGKYQRNSCFSNLTESLQRIVPLL